MGYGNLSGQARTNPRNPHAFGVCDYCGFWRNLYRLEKQFEFFGPGLQWTGYLVCHRCLDKPQDQLRPIVLPPDPVSVENPRPENFTYDYGLQNFTQYTTFLSDQAEQSKAAVLAAVASLSGVATPSVVNDYSSSVTQANVTQTVMAANPARAWLLIYNPSNPQLAVSLGTAVWGLATNLMVGPGLSLLGSGSTVPRSAVTAIGLVPGVPFYAWDG